MFPGIASVKKTVYYLTGMGGNFRNGLAQELLARGWNVIGRELSGEFRTLAFQDQVDAIAADITETLSNADARVIANSFGAYLFLHALSKQPPFEGKAMLLSPIVGGFEDAASFRTFSPPYPRRLLEIARGGQFPALPSCEIHVGSDDWQSSPSNVTAFGRLIGARVKIVEGAGHMLPQEYVKSVLDEWLQ